MFEHEKEVNKIAARLRVIFVENITILLNCCLSIADGRVMTCWMGLTVALGTFICAGLCNFVIACSYCQASSCIDGGTFISFFSASFLLLLS